MKTPSITRRNFLQTTAAAGVTLAMPNGVFAQGSDTLKVGLIGCGGRGTGAAHNCFEAAPGVELIAMGDLFKDRLDSCASYLKDEQRMGTKGFKVSNDRMFTGWDAYQKVLETDCQLVILATPPAFRPAMLEAAIKAGKHVFMEKPVAVDGAGIQKVFDASDMAKAKGLSIVAGTQRRHQNSYTETIKRIHDGEIGDITSMSCYWNQGGLWMNVRQDNWTDMEWQLKNWLYFTWLSGDHICEQHIHNIDVCLWAKDEMPAKCIALGGRQARTDAAYGHVFDHFAVEFSFGDGTKLHSYCRQQDGTVSNVSESIQGTKGWTNGTGSIKGLDGKSTFRFDGANPNPYVQEHTNLIKSIRGEGKAYNEGRQVANSTLAAIMGRLAAYSGQEITPELALATASTLPEELSFHSLPVPPVAIPGQYKI